MPAVTPLGIDDPAPRFTWRLTGPGDIRQLSLQVLVASRADLLRPGAADVWDSGEVKSSDPACLYAGPGAPCAHSVFLDGARRHERIRRMGGAVVVRNWTPLRRAIGRASGLPGLERRGPLTEAEGVADDAEIRATDEFCRPVSWLTTSWSAALKKNNQGECREIRPAPMFRKTFRVTKRVVGARLYSAGLAYQDVAINGRATSNRVLEPAFTNYARTVLYTTDDVTGLLMPGENVVAVVLGSGHFDDAARTWDWGWEDAEWRATPRLRLDLRVSYADGTEEIIASDPTWKVC